MRKLRAPNPSAMTLDGTNSYVIPVGPGALIVIDPGPDIPSHTQALLELAEEMRGQFVGIFVTHGHPDHYPGAITLRKETRAPIFAHRAATYGANRALDDKQKLTFEDASFTVIAAPGHARDHVVFFHEEERALYTGDVVIGEGTVVIAPPSGDMRAYQATLERLLRGYGDAAVIYGGHGPSIRAPRAKLEEYIAHRARREEQLLEILADGPATIPALVTEIYAETRDDLWPAAARQVLAYLIALEREGRVRSTPLRRFATPEERHILNPDLSSLARSPDFAVVRAELGFGAAPEPLVQYSRIR